MKIHSFNEWDTLREIVVGSADCANWPSNDPVFAEESKKTTWMQTAVPNGSVPQWIIDEANEDLEGLANILKQAGVVVHRPAWMDFQTLHGMYNYCPRDRLLIAGDTIVDPAMMYPCRDMEWKTLAAVTTGNPVKHMPRNEGMVLDAANICRLGDTWLYLESWSGNNLAYQWLCEQFPNINIEKCNFYAGVHIDSTIVPLREGLVMINGSRVMPEQLPACLQDWDVIWVHQVEPQDFYQYPYASKWIAMNTLSINPDTVIVDAAQTDLIREIESRGITVIPHTLRHSRTLGGGFHCVTLDTWRE
jgi:scyllo-inosamine-4-phosphate amidinotransferase 1